MATQAQLLPGTLDLLILRAVSLGPLHGYAVLLRIEQISAGALLIEQGALYPGLYRLERQGLLTTSWGISENNRRAKFYELTATGRRRLREETESWNRLATAIASALAVQPEEIRDCLTLFVLMPVVCFGVPASTTTWRKNSVRISNTGPTIWSVRG